MSAEAKVGRTYKVRKKAADNYRRRRWFRRARKAPGNPPLQHRID